MKKLTKNQKERFEKYWNKETINELITSTRNWCESKGIPFIVDDDDKLLARIDAERGKEGKAGAKIVILAGEDTVTSDDFAPLRDDEKSAFVVGVEATLAQCANHP